MVGHSETGTRGEIRNDYGLGQSATPQRGKGTYPALVNTGHPSLPCPPVVLRMAVEPAGYMDLGHAKALVNNAYYARKYGGRLILRIDDCNPAKSKGEYERALIQDLCSLGILPDQVTHTSDGFATCQAMAYQLILSGYAYMDNTPRELIAKQRELDRPSPCRNRDVMTNSHLFQLMLSGIGEGRWNCLRAKTPAASQNRYMHDPVLYRFMSQEHYITDRQYCAYPTHNLAFPVLDALEGVTHTLANGDAEEYMEQYQWVRMILGLAPVSVQFFGDLSFPGTVISEQRLGQIVRLGLVEGWDDPRLATIRGVIRAGMSMEALKDFLLSLGGVGKPIQVSMSSIWGVNRKHWEQIAPRYMAITSATMVEMTVSKVPPGITTAAIPLHPRNPSIGERDLHISNSVIIEGEDADKLIDGEEITLLRWTSIKVTKVERGSNRDDSTNRVTSIESEYLPVFEFKKKKKAVTWLANCVDLVPLKLVHYGPLLTKPLLEEGECASSFINPRIKTECDALGDPEMRSLRENDVIQLERRGFYRVERSHVSATYPMVLFLVPDGRPNKGARRPANAVATPTISAATASFPSAGDAEAAHDPPPTESLEKFRSGSVPLEHVTTGPSASAGGSDDADDAAFLRSPEAGTAAGSSAHSAVTERDIPADRYEANGTKSGGESTKDNGQAKEEKISPAEESEPTTIIPTNGIMSPTRDEAEPMLQQNRAETGGEGPKGNGQGEGEEGSPTEESESTTTFPTNGGMSPTRSKAASVTPAPLSTVTAGSC